MQSFVAKHAVKLIAEAAGCSDERSDKLGCIAKWTTAVATGDILGLLADRAVTKYKENKGYVQKCPTLPPDAMRDYDSGGDEEVEMVLAHIQPFLQMAMEAYKDTSMAEKFPFVKRSKLIRDLKEPTKLMWKFTTDTEVHVCVLEDGGTLVFAFRGTELIDWTCPLGDILTNLKQKQAPLEYYDASKNVSYKAHSSVKVHKGFQLAFQDVIKTHRRNENLHLVAEGLGVKEQDVKRVVCIGHSLGGALATLCAHWCRYVGYREAQIWCVTIGSPRVGNRAFAKDFNENVIRNGCSYRVVNKGDVVPSMPHLLSYPKICSVYKHIEGLIYLSEHPTSKDTIVLKRGGRRPIFMLPSFMDHPCIAYINSIDKALYSFLYVGGCPLHTPCPPNHVH